MSEYHDRASGPPRLVDGPGCTPARVADYSAVPLERINVVPPTKVVDAGREPFRGTLREAIGCADSVPMPAEFWVQTSQWGKATCGQHLASVVRLGFGDDPANAVVVDRSPMPSVPCRMAQDPHLQP